MCQNPSNVEHYRPCEIVIRRLPISQSRASVLKSKSREILISMNSHDMYSANWENWSFIRQSSNIRKEQLCSLWDTCRALKPCAHDTI